MGFGSRPPLIYVTCLIVFFFFSLPQLPPRFWPTTSNSPNKSIIKPSRRRRPRRPRHHHRRDVLLSFTRGLCFSRLPRSVSPRLETSGRILHLYLISLSHLSLSLFSSFSRPALTILHGCVCTSRSIEAPTGTIDRWIGSAHRVKFSSTRSPNHHHHHHHRNEKSERERDPTGVGFSCFGVCGCVGGLRRRIMVGYTTDWMKRRGVLEEEEQEEGSRPERRTYKRREGEEGGGIHWSMTRQGSRWMREICRSIGRSRSSSWETEKKVVDEEREEPPPPRERERGGGGCKGEGNLGLSGRADGRVDRSTMDVYRLGSRKQRSSSSSIDRSIENTAARAAG